MAEGPEVEEAEVRRTNGRRSVDEGRLKQICQTVTMAVMVAMGEACSVEEAEEDQGLSFATCIMLMIVVASVCWKLRTMCAAAVFLKKRSVRRKKKK